MPSFVLFVCLSPFRFVFLFSDVFNHGVWQCLDELSDPSVRSLASRLESTVITSRALGTTEAYRRAFLRWKVFASSKREIFVLFLQSQSMWRYTYSIYWIPPIPTQRSTLPYLEYSGHTIWRVYLPLQTTRSSRQLAGLLRE